MSGFTPKQINEHKLKAFSMGNMGAKKVPSRYCIIDKNSILRASMLFFSNNQCKLGKQLY